ncbi:MAG TPA: hypothetical protein VMF06_10685 [Candidatus Limnocylindria bacterium]|jgi:hypothetical protein|nr:hypothetical protein [Candidatus Limnocylindria bacterium]
MKKILIVLGVLLVVAVVALFLVGSNLGRIVKAGIEQFGPKFTGTSVTVESVSLSPSSGSGAIHGLVVGNPAGYTTPYAIRLGSASLALDPSTLLKDKVVIKSIQVTDPEINIEGGLTDNNLKKIMANLDSFSAGEKGQPAESTGAKKKLEVDDFLLSGAKVNVKLSMVGLSTPTVTLPDIHLTNLGTGPDGITPGALTKEIIGEIVSKTITAVTAQVGNLGKGATDAAKKAGSEAVDGAKKIGDFFKKK